jgi:quercetin dioxygenase-like cupin family protein
MATAAGQPKHDPIDVDSKHYSIELETEQVRVLRAKYGPGEKSQMHSHPALIGVMVSDAHIRMHFPDGTSEDIQAKAGDILNMPATVHQPENLTDHIMEVVLIEFKK